MNKHQTVISEEFKAKLLAALPPKGQDVPVSDIRDNPKTAALRAYRERYRHAVVTIEEV